MNHSDPEMLSVFYREACRFDVVSIKPGNVSIDLPGHAMDAGMFLRSADQSAEDIARPGQSLGQRILSAITATRNAVGCNTNLGIVLLCAPLIQDMP